LQLQGAASKIVQQKCATKFSYHNSLAEIVMKKFQAIFENVDATL